MPWQNADVGHWFAMTGGRRGAGFAGDRKGVGRPYYLVTAKTLAVILSEAKDLEESRKRFFVADAPQNDKFIV